jgi:hypothetical protein
MGWNVMRKLAVLLTFVTLLVAFDLRAQRPEIALGEPERLADDWMVRLNALDDWSLSSKGKEEGFAEVLDHMMELYAPNVLAQVPPFDKDQLGPVQLRGSEQLRKYFERIARTQVRLAYIIPTQTAKEYEGVEVVYSKQLPWGGLGVSFPILAVYSSRQNRHRFMSPGMVVLQTGSDKKIQRMRLYWTELSEVSPL